MTPKQRAHWQRLSPNHRRILVSHRRDDFEQDEHAARTTRRALEFASGPTQWDATVAVLAEGEPTHDELRRANKDAPDEDEWTLADIGTLLGLHRERVRCIQNDALAKLRASPAIAALLREHHDGTPPPPHLRALVRRFLATDDPDPPR
jgi:DNA-directed RNA polymerase sigma subunit (sigma70/sigma32)